MTIQQDLLSVIIPAYNKPEYLRKCLDSILAQSYRPIQIVVSDDHSPNSLEPLIFDICQKCDSLINILYVKPVENLRPYWNLHFALSKALGNFAIIMPHDDYFLDREFFKESIAQIVARDSCYVSIANSSNEGSDNPMMSLKDNSWKYIEGRKYVAENLYKDMHPSYSAVVFDLSKLLQLDYSAFFVKKEDAKRLEIEPDEGFLMINLLASEGVVSITGKIVSERGHPIDSYSKSHYWQKNWARGLFIVHFQLYMFYVKRDYLECARVFKRMLVQFPQDYYDSKIITYLNFSMFAQYFMLLSVARAFFFKPLIFSKKMIRRLITSLRQRIKSS